MKRAHRRNHVRLWLIVAPLAIVGLVVALVLRPPEPAGPRAEGSPASGEAGR